MRPGGDDAASGAAGEVAPADGDALAYIKELRLDWGSLDLAELDRLAAIAARPKLLRAVRCIRALAQDAALLNMETALPLLVG